MMFQPAFILGHMESPVENGRLSEKLHFDRIFAEQTTDIV
jgi:hypothetical protein